MRLFSLLVLFLAVSAQAKTPYDGLRETTAVVQDMECGGSASVVEVKSGRQYILTNNHVCNCARYMGKINVLFDNGELLTGEFAKGDWGVDLCVAHIKGRRKALKLGHQLLPLTRVYTRGYPYGRLAESTGTVGTDITWAYTTDIGALGTCPLSSDRLYGYNGNPVACRLQFVSTATNLYGRPGSSGSAVVNAQGELVGVISSFFPGTDYDAGIVRFGDLREFLKGL